MKIVFYCNLLSLFLGVTFSCLADWQIEWEKPLSGAIVGNVVGFDSHYIVASGNAVTALNTKGNILWQTEIQGNIRATVAVDDNAIYVNSDAGVYRLNKAGEIRWYFASQDGIRQIPGTSWGWGDGFYDDAWALYRSTPVVDSKNLYFGNLNGAFAVDKANGRLNWHQKRVGAAHTAPVLFEDTVIFADWNNRLTALERNTGKVKWHFEAKLPDGKWADWYGWVGLHLSPVIADKQILVGSRGTYFYNVDAASGKANWSWKHPSSWIGSPATVIGGLVFFAMSDGFTVHGMNIQSGNQTLLYDAGFSSFATPIQFQNQLLIGTMSGRLHAIDLDSHGGKVIYTTAECRKQCDNYVLPSGGLNYQAIKPDNTPAGMQKVVNTMLKQLNSILSISVINDSVLLGTANGRLIKLSLNLKTAV